MSSCSICGRPGPVKIMTKFEAFKAIAGPEARICRYCYREIVPFRIISLLPLTVEWEQYSWPGHFNRTIRLGYRDWRCSCRGAHHAPFFCYHQKRLLADEAMNRIPIYKWPRRIEDRVPDQEVCDAAGAS